MLPKRNYSSQPYEFLHHIISGVEGNRYTIRYFCILLNSKINYAHGSRFKCRVLLLFGKVSIKKGSLDSFYSLPPRLLRWNREDIRLTTCKLGFHKCANIYTTVTKHIITMRVWFRNIHLPSYDISNSDVKQTLDRLAISIILSQQTIHRWTPRRSAILVWLSGVIFHTASFVENSVSLPLRIFRRMQLENATIETCFGENISTHDACEPVGVCKFVKRRFSIHDILGLCFVAILFLWYELLQRLFQSRISLCVISLKCSFYATISWLVSELVFCIIGLKIAISKLLKLLPEANDLIHSANGRITRLLDKCNYLRGSVSVTQTIERYRNQYNMDNGRSWISFHNIITMTS